MRLAEWAAQEGISRLTAYHMYREGRLPVEAHKLGGLILVKEPKTPGKTAIYARVSSHDQKTDLDRQVARLSTWAATNDHHINQIVTEIGSALNGARPKFTKLLADPQTETIIVEHQDRYARYGAAYINAAMGAHGREIIVVDDSEIDDDLVRDVTEILTSLCARLYGRRTAANRAKQLAAAASAPDNPL